jgi:hypothetical protein
MEGKVVRFIILTGLNPENMYAELVSVHGSDVFVLQILYKCHKRFAQRRMELFDDL